LKGFEYVKSEELVNTYNSNLESLPAKPEVLNQYACCEWSEDKGCNLGYGAGLVFTGKHASIIDAYSIAAYDVASDDDKDPRGVNVNARESKVNARYSIGSGSG